MAENLAVQPDPDAPIQVAKKLLREERYAEVDGVGRVPIASALTGAPLAYFSEGSLPEGSVTAHVGALTLGCAISPLAPEDAQHLAPRYVIRHGAPHGAGQFCMMVPQEASLEGRVLAPADLLTEGDGPLIAYERSAVDHMNDDHLDAVKSYAEGLLGAQKGEWRLASLDMEGLDLVRCDANGTDFRRLWFHPPLAAPGEIKSKLVALAIAGRAS